MILSRELLTILGALALCVCSNMLLCTYAYGGDIYRYVDESGRVYYSSQSKSSEDVPVDLPLIQREDLNNRIDQIRKSTPATCLNHGGINCAQGPDLDGSVICNDEFSDVQERYIFVCMEARLKVAGYGLVDKSGKLRHYNSTESLADQLAKSPLTGVQVIIRNESPVAAYGINVRIPAISARNLQIENLGAGNSERASSILNTTSDRIEAYGVGEFVVPIQPGFSLGKLESSLVHNRVSVRCTNCR